MDEPEPVDDWPHRPFSPAEASALLDDIDGAVAVWVMHHDNDVRSAVVLDDAPEDAVIDIVVETDAAFEMTVTRAACGWITAPSGKSIRTPRRWQGRATATTFSLASLDSLTSAVHRHRRSRAITARLADVPIRAESRHQRRGASTPRYRSGVPPCTLLRVLPVAVARRLHRRRGESAAGGVARR